MNMRRHLIETLTLIIVAVVIASISNALASRDRKLAASGSYANATTVPGSQQAPTRPAENPPPSAPEQAPMTAEPEVGTAEPATSEPAAVPSPLAPSSRKAPEPLFSKEDILKRFPAKPDEPLVEVSGDDVMWLYASGALFLDARRTSAYEAGHIAGARNFAVWEGDVDEKVAQLVEAGTDPEMPIVVYCSGGNCEDSHMLAQKLWGMFFNNVLVYKDGYPDWKKRGGAVKTGSEP